METFEELFSRIDEHNSAHASGDMGYAACRMAEIDAFLDDRPQCEVTRIVERFLSSELRGCQIVIAGNKALVGTPSRGIIASFRFDPNADSPARAIIEQLLWSNRLTHRETHRLRERLMEASL